MNEWLPGGNYSCPGTPNTNGRSLRFQQDDSGRGIKPLVNKRALPESKSRNFLPHSMEDIPKGFSNKKSSCNGTSDPRFKRVVPVGVQNDACVGTEVKTVKPVLVLEEKKNPLYNFSILDAPEFKPNKTWLNCVKTSEQSKLEANEKQEQESLNIAEDFNFSQLQDHLKAVDNLSFNHDIVVSSACKESASECTVNTRNTSLVSDEFAPEIPSTLAKVLSPRKVKNVEDWVHERGQKLDKKHSVITVIGQIQEPDVLSSAFQEIDKRRKLVKELDRYAVCQRIIETNKEKEISNLMEKISSLNNNESTLFHSSNETLSTNTHSVPRKNCGKLNNLSHTSNSENNVSHSNDDSSDPRKNSFFKRNLKEFQRSNYPVKGRLQTVFGNFAYQWVFCILIVMSGVLFWFAFFSIQKGVYVSFDLFNSKPKPITWYEKICNWLWELFRPSNNYHRTSQWRSY